jgi:hypothetical protein
MKERRAKDHDLAPQRTDRSLDVHDPVVEGRVSVSVGEVWQTLRQHSFAVVAYSTPRGDPRSSGVVYGVLDGQMYVAVAPSSWKARDVARAAALRSRCLYVAAGRSR